jgi:hypothetical protein
MFSAQQLIFASQGKSLLYIFVMISYNCFRIPPKIRKKVCLITDNSLYCISQVSTNQNKKKNITEQQPVLIYKIKYGFVFETLYPVYSVFCSRCTLWISVGMPANYITKSRLIIHGIGNFETFIFTVGLQTILCSLG